MDSRYRLGSIHPLPQGVATPGAVGQRFGLSRPDFFFLSCPL